MVDAIVVGAGPAGTAAALTLARAGARVIVVDRAPADHGRDGVAALLPETRQVFSSLDVVLAADPLADLRGWQVTWPAGAAATVDAPTAVVEFRRALQAMQTTALAAGARFEWGWHVRRLLTDERTGAIRGVVMARRDRRAVRMSARVVVVADGWRSRLTGARPATAPAGVWRAVDQLVTDVPSFPDRGEIYVGRRAYLELIPAGGRFASLRLVQPRSPGFPGASVAEVAIRAFPALAVRLSRARTVARRNDQRGTPAAVPVVAAGSVAAGHAAGVFDPWGAADLHAAIVDGWRAGTAVAGADDVADPDVPAGVPKAPHRLDPAARWRWSVLARPPLAAAAGVAARIVPAWPARHWLRVDREDVREVPTAADRGESEAMMDR